MCANAASAAAKSEPGAGAASPHPPQEGRRSRDHQIGDVGGFHSDGLELKRSSLGATGQAYIAGGVAGLIVRYRTVCLLPLTLLTQTLLNTEPEVIDAIIIRMNETNVELTPCALASRMRAHTFFHCRTRRTLTLAFHPRTYHDHLHHHHHHSAASESA
jgi:hypothetical protein